MLLKTGGEKKEYWFAFNGIDKVIHIGIFVLLGFLFRAAFPKMRKIYYFSLLFLYSLLTEILQHLMQQGRTGEMMDLLADMFGVFIGYMFYHFIVGKMGGYGD